MADYLSKYDKQADGKKYLTASQITTFVSCGVCYRKQYIERLPSRVGSAANFGTAFHTSENDNNFKLKVKSKVDVPIDVVQDAFANKIDELTPEIEWSVEEKSVGIEKSHAGLKDEGCAAVKVFHSEIAPKISPVSVEQTIIIPLEGFDYSIAGTWDIETENGILDLKTRGKTPSQSDVTRNLGLTIYSLGKSVKDNKYPDYVGLTGIVRLKTPKTFDLRGTRTIEDFNRLLLTVGKIKHAIDQGIFLPCDPGHWKCSEAWCSFFNDCKEKL